MSSCSTSEKSDASGCGCGHPVAFDGASPAYKRALTGVIALNVTGFVVVAIGSWLAASASLAANTLDFAADAATYALSLWAIGKSVHVRSGAAFFKSTSLADRLTALRQFHALRIREADRLAAALQAAARGPGK